ncbi:MAG TPA: PAS domain-containing protein [Chroococcidiopsis sp.]
MPFSLASSDPVMTAIALMNADTKLCNFACEIDGQGRERLAKSQRSCVLVKEGDRLVGIVTERDLVRLQTSMLVQQPWQQPVAIADIMSTPVLTLNREDFTDIFVPLNLLQRHSIRHLPIVDQQGAVIGLVTHDSLRPLLRDIELLHLPQVSEVMTTTVVHAPLTATLEQLTQQMATDCVSSVVITDSRQGSHQGSDQGSHQSSDQNGSQDRTQDSDQGHLIPVGIITERDIVQALALALDFSKVQAQTIMSTPVIAVEGNTSLWNVRQQMYDWHINQVVVIDDNGGLAGIVTQTDLLSVLNPMAIYRRAEWLIQERTRVMQMQVERERLFTHIASQIRSSLSLPKVLDTAVTSVRAFLQCDRLLVYQFQPDWSGSVTAESVGEGWRSCLNDQITDPCFQAKALTLYGGGRSVAVDNIATAGYSDCHLNLLETYQVKANLVVPILVSGQLWGLLMGHQCSSPRSWQAADLALLDKLGLQLAIAIQQATAYQQAQAELLERKRAEAKLKASEERYRQIVETTLEGVWILDIDNRTSYVNPRMAEMLGYTVDEMLGKTLFDFMDSEGETQALINLERRHQGIEEQHDFRFKTKTGEDVWMLIATNPLYDAEGHYVGALGMLTDISDRKQAEAALIRSEAQSQAVLAAIPDLMFRIGADGVYRGYVTAPSTVDAMLQGIDPVGQQMVNVLPPALAERQRGAIAQVLATGEMQVYEQQVQIGDRIQDEEVRVVKSGDDEVLFMIRDISDRKQAAAEKQQAEKLRVELTILENILDTILAGYWDADLVNGTQYISPGFKHMFGYEDHELANSPETWKTLVLPEDLPKAFAAYQNHIQSHGEIPYRVELRYRHKNGSTVWIICSGQVIEWDVAGNPLRLIGCHIDITERKQAEKTLHDLSKRLELAVEAAQVGIWEWDIQGDRLVWDKRMFGLYGILPEEFEGNFAAWLERIHPDDSPNLQRLRQHAYSGASHYNNEFRVIHPDGTIRFLSSSALIQRNAQGQPQRIIGLNIDITERTVAELETQQLRERLQFMLSSSPAVIFACRPDASLSATFVSDNIVEVMGYASKQWLAEPNTWIDNVHPDDIPRLYRETEQLFGQGHHLWEYRFRHPDGDYRWKQDGLKIIYDAHENPAEVIGYTIDIHDRKQAEAKLEQQAQREHLVSAISQRIRASLNLSEILNTTVAEVHHVLQTDRVLVYRIMPDGTGKTIAESVSPGWPVILDMIFPEEIFPRENYDRYVQGRVFALTDRETGPVLPCLADFLRDLKVRAKLVVPIVENNTLWGLLIAHQCEGPRQWQEWEIDVLRQLSSQLAIAIQQSQLYARLQESHHQLSHTNAELLRATRLKDEFLANMSHELRTPLNAILGLSEGLLEGVLGSLNDEQIKAIATVERSGQHLLGLINDILELSKIEAGKLELDIQHVSIAQLCKSSLAFVKQQAFKKQIQLNIALASDLGDISVDERRIRQVLINLLTNAVKFTPTGGQVTLEVHAEPMELNLAERVPLVRRHRVFEAHSLLPSHRHDPGHALCISVVDTGIGIAPTDQARLFQPFVQIDSNLNRHYEGTGLGLALVKQIVELHGGDVSLESEVGRGSCFSVRLPYVCQIAPASAGVSPDRDRSDYPAPSPLNNPSHSTNPAPGSANGLTAATANAAPAVNPVPAASSVPALLAPSVAASPPSASPEIAPGLQPDRQGAPEITAEITAETAPASPQPPLILLAEDNEANVSTISAYLEAKGYSIVVAQNGEEAIAMTQQYRPHLILMDIQMPKVDGLEAIQTIRQEPQFAAVPIIALTALAMTGDREKCIAAGANEYLSKPVKLKQLDSMIQRLLAIPDQS